MASLTNPSDLTIELSMDDGFTLVTRDSKKRRIQTPTPETSPTTSRQHRNDTNTDIQRQIDETTKTLGVNRQTTTWDIVISSNQTLKQSLVDEAISRYCKDTIITKAKLTASKRSIFYTFENPQKAFNKIHKHIDEISTAIKTKLKVDVWRTEPPTRTNEKEPTTHCVARDIPTDYTDTWLFDKIHPTIKENIIRVGRIKTGIEGIPTHFVRIICRNTETTEHLLTHGLLIGNRKFSVVPAKPAHKVLQCYNCQLFGHHAIDCKQATYCGKCSGNHKTRDCTLTPKTGRAHCANCQQPHPAYSATCIAYRKEVEKKKQQQQEQIRKQEQKVHTAVGTGTWANIVKQTEQTTTQIQKITSNNHEETKKLIAENETNIKSTLSEGLADFKNQMTTMIQQEVKKMFAEVIQQVRNELTTALEEAKQQMLDTIRRQIHKDINTVREQITLDIQTQVKATTKETVDTTLQAIVQRNRSQSLPRNREQPTNTTTKPKESNKQNY
jgi:hypothetical protein